MATNQHVIRYVNSVLNSASEGMLDHFVVEMQPEEIYAMMCSYDQEMLASFSKAAGYLPKEKYLGQVVIPVLLPGRTQAVSLMFNVGMESCAKYRNYFKPETIAAITPESYVYSKLDKAITLAQDWAITKALFHQFSAYLSTDQIAATLPWLKDLGRDGWMECKDMDGDHRKFTDEYDLGFMNSKKFEQVKAAFKRLGYPRSSAGPAKGRRIGAATLIGNRLLTQWRIMKKEAPKSYHSFVSIAQHDLLLPPWFQPDMDDISRYWEQLLLGVGSDDDSGE